MKLEFIVQSYKTHLEECKGCSPPLPLCIVQYFLCRWILISHIHVHTMHTNMHIFCALYAHVQILLSIKDLVVTIWSRNGPERKKYATQISVKDVSKINPTRGVTIVIQSANFPHTSLLLPWYFLNGNWWYKTSVLNWIS